MKKHKGRAFAMPKVLGVRSSLDRKAMDLVPDIYHRTQEGSGLKTERDQQIPHFSERDRERSTDFENPNIASGQRSFKIAVGTDKDGLPVFNRVTGEFTNYEVSSEFCKVANGKAQRRTAKLDKQHKFKGANFYFKHCRDEYFDSLEMFNICFRCLNPIKTKVASVEAIDKTRFAVISRIQNSVGERAVLGRVTSRTVELSIPESSEVLPKSEQLSVRKRHSVSRRDIYRGEAYRVKHEFTSDLYSPTTAKPNQMYADIKPHFQIRTDSAGRYYVRLETGECDAVTEMRIRFEKGRKYYYLRDLETGQTLDLENYIPPETYRVYNQQCSCAQRKFEQAQLNLKRKEAKLRKNGEK